MKCCYGPCEQGRRKCPMPEACQIDIEEPKQWWDALAVDVVLAVALVGVVAAMVWGVI